MMRSLIYRSYICKGDEMDLSDRIPVSKQTYLDKLNEALGETYLAKGFRFFESPNHLHPGSIDWLRDPDNDPVFIRALQEIEAKYRYIPEDITPDSQPTIDGQET